jgi:methyl-accepting chemotaxis protein
MKTSKTATLSIGARLRLGFALIQLLLVILTILGLHHMAQMQERIDEITWVNSVKTQLAGAMRDTVFERMIALRNMALIGSMSYLQPEADNIDAQAKAYKDAERKLEDMLSASDASPREKGLLQKIRQHESAAQPWIAKITQLAFGAESDQIYTVLVDQLLPAQRQWTAALRELTLLEQEENTHAAQQAQTAYRDARLLMLGIGALAILAGLAVSFLLTRNLLGQLGGEPACAADIAAGDSSSLLFAMKTMRDNLAELVGKVRGNVAA